MRVRRVASTVIALAIGAALVGPGPVARAATPGPGDLVAYSGDVDSYAAGQSSKVQVALPLAVEAFATRTRAHIDSQPRTQAFAGVVDVPLGELLGLLGIPVVLPTYCYADFPGTPDNDCGVVPLDSAEQPTALGLGVLAGGGSVHAVGDIDDPSKSEARSAVAGTSVRSPAFTIGASTSRSEVKIVDGIVVSTTTAKLSDVNIAGVLAIDSIVSTATAKASGVAGGADATGEFDFSGVSVAGIPIKITPQGIIIGSFPNIPPIPILGLPVPTPSFPSIPIDLSPVFTVVVQALKSAGITFSPFENPVLTESADGRAASATVKGFGIRVDQLESGSFQELRLGVATASSTATIFEDSAPEIQAPSDDSSGSVSDVAAPSLGSDTVSLPPSSGDTEIAAPETPAANSGTTAPTASLPDSLSPIARRFRGVYAGTAVATMLGAVAGYFSILGGKRRRLWSEVLPQRFSER